MSPASSCSSFISSSSKNPVSGATSVSVPATSPSTRSGRTTAEPRPCALISSSQHDPRVVRDVVRDGGALVPDRLRCERVALRHPFAHCQHDLVGVLASGPMPGGRNQRARLRIQHADPCNRETPCFDCDAAGLLEQLSAVAHAHDRGVDAAQHRVDAVEGRDPFILRLALAHVLDYGHDVSRAPVRPAHRGGGNVRPDHGAILAQVTLLACIARDLAAQADARCIHSPARGPRAG
jgi:hypothetical protein